MAVVIPIRVADSGIAAVFKPLLPLFSSEDLESMKQIGMFALSEPGKLDDLLAVTGLTVQQDAEIECPVAFDDPGTTAQAFMGAGPMALAIRHSGEQAIAQAVRDALVPFTGTDGRVTLPTWYRAVLAQAANTSR